MESAPNSPTADSNGAGANARLELSVGISPLGDFVVLCCGEERVSLSPQQAIHFMQMLSTATQQVIDAGKTELPKQ